MSQNLKVCVDRVLPMELREELDLKAMSANPANVGQMLATADEQDQWGIAIVRHHWPPGQRLHVCFIGGDRQVWRKVQEIANIWTEYANVEFIFDQKGNAEIRVAFMQGQGSWSWVGMEALQRPLAEPTMNLGWLTVNTDDQEYRRVVLHEFGHVLGCIHEHLSPASNIQWNKQAVYDFYKGAPNHWTEADIDAQMFDKYSRLIKLHSVFDEKSIMIYAIPPEHTLDGYSIGWNHDLSEKDKEYIAKVYPK